jgi:hypothetical protein
LTATGTVGALAFATWAGADRLFHWRASRRPRPMLQATTGASP